MRLCTGMNIHTNIGGFFNGGRSLYLFAASFAKLVSSTKSYIMHHLLSQGRSALKHAPLHPSAIAFDVLIMLYLSSWYGKCPFDVVATLSPRRDGPLQIALVIIRKVYMSTLGCKRYHQSAGFCTKMLRNRGSQTS